MKSKQIFKNAAIKQISFEDNKDVVFKFVSTDKEHVPLGVLICKKIIYFCFDNNDDAVYDFEDDYSLSSILIFGVDVKKMDGFFEIKFDMPETIVIKCKDYAVIDHVPKQA